MKTDIAYIYALIDPRDNEVRYIGKTINPKRRLVEHLNDSKREYNYKAMWIKSLLKEDIKPLIKFLKICPLSDFVKYEVEYIELYKNSKLTNSDETGQGSIGRRKEIIDKQSEKMSRVVYQYDIDGNFIKEFKSVRFAANILGLSHSNISRCCNGLSKHAGGFIFSYEKSDSIESVSNPNALKKVVLEIDDVGNIINEWSSIMDCTRSTGIDHGNLSRVCNGIRKSIKGRIFKFK